MSDTAQKQVPIRAGVFDRENFRHPKTSLRGSRCGECQETFFPHRGVCPRCRSALAIETVTLGRTGFVHALTRVERTPAHYPKPYALGKVDLPEGVRILTQVGEADELRIGDQVTLVIGPLFVTSGGEEVWGYWFRPTCPG